MPQCQLVKSLSDIFDVHHHFNLFILPWIIEGDFLPLFMFNTLKYLSTYKQLIDIHVVNAFIEFQYYLFPDFITWSENVKF